MMDTLTDQEAKDKLDIMIKCAIQDQSKFLITSPEGNVVMISEEAYQNLMITLEMLSTPIFLENSQL
jgi:PHD/YefM family antitoxin component YafN of YafNO toxin-antitoxin module